ncbi:unnamed protein product [Cuscuta epithymum]|uniref:DUF4378 domain-containing protein n=1 Tax=Cuscuta epithymum TaxID=186058 RepID=A0AAV0FW15_9ASTE|nr:unnamed protein product [Cuscuta epithymum]
MSVRAAAVSALREDDHRNLNKQIGCMNGIFHLFERHHFRRVGRHTNKRLLSANHNMESAAEQLKLEKIPMVFKESSKILPSLDQSKTTKLESPPLPPSNQTSFHQRDLKGAVKDSMHREARSISIKTVTKTEGRVQVVKHVDSPRPSQPDGLTKAHAKKLLEPRRLSYDGRESGGKAMKVKEIPRLSLDSRVKSIQTSACESRSNFLLLGNNHKRSPSVVAKLMGLEEPSYSPPSHEDEMVPKGSGVAPHQQRLSVYSEIEKRITELEFQKSGKDLRALKQILEAIQRSERQETNTPLVQQNSISHSPRRSMESSSRHIIRKPAKLNDDKIRPVSYRENLVADERKSLSPRRSYNKDAGQHLSNGKKKNGKAVQGGLTGAVSPRLQPHLPPLELSRVRKHQGTPQTKESGLRSRRYKLKSSNQKPEVKIEIRNDIKSFSDQYDIASIQSESDNSLASCMDTEVTSKYRSKPRRSCKEMDPSMMLNEELPISELQISMKEQRSPVSVLDSTFYIEDSPSPVKKISTPFRDYDAIENDEAKWHSKDFTTNAQFLLSSEIKNDKSKEDDILLHNLRLTNSLPCVDQTEFFCHDDNDVDEDHEYINKILLASGILRDVNRASTISWLHPTVHLINPELFDVLEQNERCRKQTSPLKFNQKTHRKMVFDTVEEIIVQKLSPEGLLIQGRKHSSGHQLLKEVHREIDYLRPAKSDISMETKKDESVSITNTDMKHESADWVQLDCVIPRLVVDIECLIFKDLITEVISDEAVQMHDRSMVYRRQLFR